MLRGWQPFGREFCPPARTGTILESADRAAAAMARDGLPEWHRLLIEYLSCHGPPWREGCALLPFKRYLMPISCVSVVAWSVESRQYRLYQACSSVPPLMRVLRERWKLASQYRKYD